MYGNWAFDPFRSTGQSVGAAMAGTGFFGGKSCPLGKPSSGPYWRTGHKKVCAHLLVFCESHEAQFPVMQRQTGRKPDRDRCNEDLIAMFRISALGLS